MKTIESLGLVFDMQVNWNQLERAAELVKQYPKLKVVLNHFGLLKLHPLSNASGRVEHDPQKEELLKVFNEKTPEKLINKCVQISELSKKEQEKIFGQKDDKLKDSLHPTK